MTKGRAGPVLMALLMETTEKSPLYRRVYLGIRHAILNGRLTAGDRLPSSRTLAEDLGVARNTVLAAYSELRSEGLVVARVGYGTSVAKALPEASLPPVTRRVPQSRMASSPTYTRAAERLNLPDGATAGPRRRKAFALGLPAVDEFPSRSWQQILGRRARQLDPMDLCAGSPAGYGPLREAVCKHLRELRGLQFNPGQVLILSSSQQAIDLCARLLLPAGGAVWHEEPGYLGTRGVMAMAGVELIPVPVDAEGLMVGRGKALAPNARMAVVTPSNQFPLGGTMSVPRRLELLEWAEKADAWILEDDYDGEFVFERRPVAPLQALDDTGRVIYVGTFSKSMYPALRLAYMVAPDAIVHDLTTLLALAGGTVPTLTQAAMAEFIDSGLFATHLRRMRGLYVRRGATLAARVNARLGKTLAMEAPLGGLHAVARFKDARDDAGFARVAAQREVQVHPLSRYYVGRPSATGLVLGYGSVTTSEIEVGVERLASALGDCA